MNLEHIEEVNARIEQIRRRFVDVLGPEPVQPATTRAGFGDILAEARSVRQSPCPEELEPAILRASERYGVDPAIIKAVMRAESGFRNDAVSRVGARGLMQLMPGTARSLGVDPSDPEQNIDGGTRYLKQLMDRFGNTEWAIAAYNAGPGCVARHGGVPPYAETQRYVERVMGYIDSYSGDR